MDSGGASIEIMLGFRVVSLDSTPSVVPEPSMMVIDSILGIGGLIVSDALRSEKLGGLSPGRNQNP